MGTIDGLLKYLIFTPITVVGFVSMYIYGGALVTLFATVDQLFTGNFIEAFLEYFVYSVLPPTSLEHVIVQTILGTVIAGFKWFFAMTLRGVPAL